MEVRARELELQAKLSIVVATDLGDALEEASEAEENIEPAIVEAKARSGSVKSAEEGPGGRGGPRVAG